MHESLKKADPQGILCVAAALWDALSLTFSNLLPGRLMAGQRPLEPYVEVRILPGQLNVCGLACAGCALHHGCRFFVDPK